jgi:hypothetical protein
MLAISSLTEAPPLSRLQTFIDGVPDMDGNAWRFANQDYALRAQIAADCRSLLGNAGLVRSDGKPNWEIVHDILETIYNREFAPADVTQTDCETLPIMRDIASILEEALLESEIEQARSQLGDHPTDGSEYVNWLKRLISSHRASRHPFYHAFIQDHSTREDLKYLLAQETCLDPRFDDILALIQLGAKGGAKMELAANYWDEMGNGQISDMHSVLFEDALAELDITRDYIDQHYLFEAKACGNISAALSLRRQHYFKAIGYYGVTEYLAPRRFRNLVSAWKRLGLPEKGMHYHELHISVDAGHAAGWFRNVVQPAMDQDPRVGRDIAIGALIRLNSSERYLDALLARTGFSDFPSH